MNKHFSHLQKLLSLAGLLMSMTFSAHLQAEEITEDPNTGLTKYPNSEYIASDWNDGDSFSVRLTDGTEVTARLYEVDAIETHINNTTDARRLRAQRRYFGISDYGGSSDTSIEKAVEVGEMATTFTSKALLNRPFTIYTSHADARGGANNKRIYVFIETADGKSLAAELARNGLARAYGVYRESPTGLHHEEARERIKDLELLAAGSRKGAWAFTNWDTLPDERLVERSEDVELQTAMTQNRDSAAGALVNPNTADAKTLEKLPGVGPVTAERIIETRTIAPFTGADDLKRVKGIGPATLDKMRDSLTFE